MDGTLPIGRQTVRLGIVGVGKLRILPGAGP